MVVRIVFSSILQVGYVEVRISRSVLEGPFDFEITRVDCIYYFLAYHHKESTLHYNFTKKNKPWHNFNSPISKSVAYNLYFTANMYKTVIQISYNYSAMLPFIILYKNLYKYESNEIMYDLKRTLNIYYQRSFNKAADCIQIELYSYRSFLLN